MRRPTGARSLTALALAAVLILGGGGPARAESALWTLVASPLAATSGVTTTFSLLATNEDPLAALLSSNEIGCVVLDVPSNFAVNRAAVTGSNAGGGWHVDSIVGNRVTVHTDSGGERLALLDWVAFTTTATPMSAGSLSWDARAYRDTQCRGSGAPIGVPPVVLVSAPVVTPAPTPSPAPPTPTPAPTSTPTLLPSLPLPSVPLPLPSVSASAKPVPSVGVVPTNTPRPTPGGSGAPLPAGAGSAGPSPATTPSSAAEAPASGGPTPGRPNASGEGPGAVPVTGSLAGQAATPLVVRFEPASLEVGLGSIGLLDSATVWAVPAATLAVPGLLLILLVALQAAGALAWIPAVRRLSGKDE